MVQFSQFSCVQLFGPMDCSIPSFSAHHQLLELAQTHAHRVGDATHLILCHALLLIPSILPSIRVFSSESVLCIRCRSTGASVSASVLPMSIQYWFPWGLTGFISLKSKELSGAFSNTIVQKHQFFGAQLSLWSNSHIYIWLLGKTIVLSIWTFVGKVMSLLFNMLSMIQLEYP